MVAVTVPPVPGRVSMATHFFRYCYRILKLIPIGNLTANSLQTIICLIGCLLCFFPVAIGPHLEFDEDIIESALTSERNRDLAVAVLALAAPVFIDIAADFCTNISVGIKSKRIRMHVRESMLKPYEQFLLTCSLLSVPTIAFLPRETHHIVTTYLCFSRFRILLVGGLVVISLSRFDKRFWSTKMTYLIVCLLAASSVTGAYADNLGLENSLSRKVADAVLLTGIGAFFVCSCRWFYTSGPNVLRIRSKVHDIDALSNQNSPGIGIGEQHLVFPLLYIVSANVSSLFLAATMRSYPTITFDAGWFFFNNLGCVVYLIFLLTISERMNKYQVLQGLVRTI